MNREESKAGRAGIGYLIGNYLIRGMSFLTTPIFVRLLSTADFGIYNSYTSYESILSIVIGFVLHTSFKNAKMKYNELFGDYVSSCILMLVLNTVILLIFGCVLNMAFGFASQLFFILLVLHSFTSALILYYHSYLSLYYKSRDYIQISLIISVGQIILSVALVLTLFSNNRAYGRIIGSFLPGFIVAICLVGYFWKAAPPNISKEYWRYGLCYSLPLIPHGLSQVILASFDRIMIANMVGNSETGIYSFAYTVNSFFLIAFSSLDQVWGPWFYEKMQKGLKREIQEAASKYAIGMALFASGIMLISPEIIYIIGTRDYYRSVFILAPILLGGFFSGLYTIVAVVEYYYEKTKYIAAGTTSAAILNIVLNYIFIKRYGYQAAAYTTLATYVLYFLFHYISAVHVNGGSLYSVRSFLIAGMIVTLAAVIMRAMLPNMWVRWGLGVIVETTLIAFLIKRFKVIEWIREKKQG